MKKTLVNGLGFTLFYLIIIFGVIILNQRFSYLNSINEVNNIQIAMNN